MKKALKKFFDFDYKPDCLIADAAPAIHNGFKAAFEYNTLDEFLRVMCWSHVERNCEEKSNGIEQKTRDEILNDIKSLQTMPSNESFDYVLSLFFNKWNGNLDVAKFLDHFKNEWIDKNKYII